MSDQAKLPEGVRTWKAVVVPTLSGPVASITESPGARLVLTADLPAIRADAVEPIRGAFDRIGGVPDRTEHIEDFAERVECADAQKIAYEIGYILAALDSDREGPKDNARQRIAAELVSHHGVRWDRFITYSGRLRAYGWLPREDGRADFLLLDFDAASGALTDWITSAHPHPASVVERLESEQSVEWERVEDHFEIPNAVRLADSDREGES